MLVTLFWLFGGGGLLNQRGQEGQAMAGAEETQMRVLETMRALNDTLSALQV